ncbi:YbgC/FadM family acyl-CoA thioesterase [uncultured Sphingomonas sp.]|uniref:YbgC/FadM family acyl-CoA thioesterase n=1 Tax=uncultured Sphingomonas sp. TaxID=158754 RepID=UPI0025F68F4F|nr:YbgC/FadM family acyl-CoA thioesterase [uncultured Sphingomonas sp.]
MPADLLDRPYVGRFVDGAHRFAVRVYYEDTDAGGVVYHANYLRFFERARSDMLALAGADIAAALTADEGGYVVAAAEMAYRAPARLGDALMVVSRLERVRTAACVIQQTVMRDDQLIAEGRLTVAWVGPDGRPRRQPKQWIHAFQGVQGSRTDA